MQTSVCIPLYMCFVTSFLSHKQKAKYTVEKWKITFTANFMAYGSKGISYAQQKPQNVYLEACLAETVLLKEQKCLTVQFPDYSAKLAGFPERLYHSSVLRYEHRQKHQTC